MSQSSSTEKLAQYMHHRLDVGDLEEADIAVRLARYGLMTPTDFVAEMNERMDEDGFEVVAAPNVNAVDAPLRAHHAGRLALAAARKLVRAYKTAQPDGASIDWSDIDDAHETARQALRDAHEATRPAPVQRNELAAILAGLRFLQRLTSMPRDIEAIHTDCGELEGLTPAGIDTLCERLSAADTSLVTRSAPRDLPGTVADDGTEGADHSRPLVVVKVSRGRVQGTFADIQAEILVLDYDVNDVGENPAQFDGVTPYPEPGGSEYPAEGYWEDPLVDSEYVARLRERHEAV